MVLTSSSSYSLPDGNFEKDKEIFWEEREDREWAWRCISTQRQLSQSQASGVWLWAVLGEGQGPPGVTRFISGWFPGWMSAVGSCGSIDLDETGDLNLRWKK